MVKRVNKCSEMNWHYFQHLTVNRG
jgi:hypothetical protein